MVGINKSKQPRGENVLDLNRSVVKLRLRPRDDNYSLLVPRMAPNVMICHQVLESWTWIENPCVMSFAYSRLDIYQESQQIVRVDPGHEPREQAPTIKLDRY